MKENSIMENAEMALMYKELKKQLNDISWYLGESLEALDIDDSDEYTDSKLDHSLDKIREIFHAQQMKYEESIRETLETFYRAR